MRGKRIPLMVGFVGFLVVVVGAALWLGPFGGKEAPIVSAQEACDLMGVPYDYHATSTADGLSWTIEMRHSGDDRHDVLTARDVATNEIVYRGETIVKDHMLYSRETTRGGDQDVFGAWELETTRVPPVFSSLPCIDTSSYSARSDNGEAHFRTVRFLSEEEGDVVDEFWADSVGRPVRARRSLYGLETEGPPEPRAARGARSSDPNATVVLAITYSGYGEANVITAPTLAPTPTLPPTTTPTPTPAPTPTPYPYYGNPRSESVTQTSVTISWDRFRVGGVLPRDYRANYRQSSSQPWGFGAYADIPTFNSVRPRATVDDLRCNTRYEFLVEVQLADGWNHYGAFTASTGAC